MTTTLITKNDVWRYILENRTQIIRAPPDGSCFYHCVYHVLQSHEGVDTKLTQTFDEYQTRFTHFVQRYGSEYTLPTEITPVLVLRYIVANALTQEDFDDYNILLCGGDEANTKYETLRQFRTGVVFDNEYANEIIIRTLLRVLDDRYGIYIVKDGRISAHKDWQGREFNFFLELEFNIHYNVIQIEGAPLVLSRQQIADVLRKGHLDLITRRIIDDDGACDCDTDIQALVQPIDYVS